MLSPIQSLGAVAVGLALITAAPALARQAAEPPSARPPAEAPAGKLPATVDPSLIPNYTLIRPGLATAGQPSEAALRQLKDLGFRTVINLRTEAEGTKPEEAAVKAAGLRYVSVPITAEGLRREDVEAVSRALEEAGSGPVLLHCTAANRVGGVWTAMEVMKGRSYEEAEAEGRKIGLRSPAMTAAVRRVLGLPEAPK